MVPVGPAGRRSHLSYAHPATFHLKILLLTVRWDWRLAGLLLGLLKY